MLSPYLTALYSPQAFRRLLRSWPAEHLHEALQAQGPSLPKEYRKALMDEIEYRRDSWSRGNEGGR
jgi:hypothetical protein